MNQPFTDLYVEIQQFYATQVQYLDALRFEEFADTFTEDGVFGHVRGAPAAHGRAGIVAALSEYQERRYGDDPTQRRHWFNMLKVMPQDDGSIVTSYYAVVLATKPGDPVALPTPSCSVQDVLVRQDGRLLAQEREVSADHTL
ncbi:nuclear transport factor 2 family protein [Amycolatopsis palatopharyngis]|uniref:nuclear transport factor 2 family protein n=1 Tax=Amycolatopsis palatopharyngis TaxID=187982 RepID=UPI000E25F782|nr:nuclear transport factor 2 family protein [Amycolatopsis palatopharyngis]